MTATTPTPTDPNAMGELEAMLHGVASAIGKLTPDSQTKIKAAVQAVVFNDLEPKVNGLIASTAKSVLGGLVGGLAAPGEQKSADAIINQLSQDMTGTQP